VNEPEIAEDKFADDAGGASSERPGEEIAGDRGIPSVNRVRSVQSRVSSALALALMSVMGLSLLGWYYSNAISRHRKAEHDARAPVQNRARGEMRLPPLGPFETPRLAGATLALSGAPADDKSSTAAAQLLGPPPELPPMNTLNSTGAAPYAAPNAKTPAQLSFERRLAGPVFASAANGSAPTDTASAPGGSSAGLAEQATAHESASAAAGERNMATLLQPTATPAVQANVLPTQRLLLPQGAFIDCTLETAIDSTLPGMTTCVTATDTFSADGTVVLLERGTKLVGETRGQVQQGAARLFVLWSEARTPTGVVVPLASPGTDELGRSGLPGEVDRHFWDRFGAALLISVVEGAIQAASQSQGGGGTVIYNPSTSSDVATEILKGTINIAPTVTKHQGDRIQILVARDLDFRRVYALHSQNP
jgi:type IV secretion system protein VirB10